ncbi:hypothetical protein CHARACLAT_019707 [Characodon lateralis]|uniref:Uncharacterized protein n=1 Tax=Characodon lateralis TaxID=208331 RepID=A0ABU7DUD4_9TELE|nr:hypothetical protein [Characodon lateralis]
MDGLRSAGRAIFRSPSMAKQSWTAGRHRKLPENWTDTRETILEGMTFNLRHFGMTLVDRPKGEQLSAAAVKRIVATVSVKELQLLFQGDSNVPLLIVLMYFPHIQCLGLYNLYPLNCFASLLVSSNFFKKTAIWKNEVQ